MSATTGFSDEVDRQLIDAAKVEQAQEWEKCVVLVMDEMYVKEDLVYDKHSGALIGFTNLADTNAHLLQFERSLEGASGVSGEPLAKSMFVFMVRALFRKLEFPYAQFPCTSVSGDLLFDPFWEAVNRLERCDFKVLAATADGASTNRRLFKIHNPEATADDVSYKVFNPYAPEGRFLFVFFRSTPSYQDREKLLGEC